MFPPTMSTHAANPGLQKAAILMVLLGEDAASHIYRNLPENDVQRLTRRIAEMEHIKPETAISVLEEYYQLSLTQGYLAEGGPEYAQKLLVKSFGEAGAQRLLDQVGNAMEQNAIHLESVQEADPQQLAKFLEVEHPQTIALVMAHLNARQASTLLLCLPEDIRAEAIKRLAQLRQFSPDVAQKVALALNKHLESVGEQSRRAYAGFKGAADLLNQLEPLKSKGILEIIEKDDPKMALGIRNLMFTFEDLLGVPEAGIRELLGQLDKKTLALSLRGATEELKNLIFKSMSSRAVDMLKEDMEVLGAVRAKDVNAAQHEIVEGARKLEAEGKLVLSAESQEEYVV
jgi:flagellar motor switch protein FliG